MLLGKVRWCNAGERGLIERLGVGVWISFNRSWQELGDCSAKYAQGLMSADRYGTGTQDRGYGVLRQSMHLRWNG